jgi:hypothetical protein
MLSSRFLDGGSSRNTAPKHLVKAQILLSRDMDNLKLPTFQRRRIVFQDRSSKFLLAQSSARITVWGVRHKGRRLQNAESLTDAERQPERSLGPLVFDKP